MPEISNVITMMDLLKTEGKYRIKELSEKLEIKEKWL